LQLQTEARGDGEKLLRYSADDASSHEYEVKRVHMDGATFDAVVFYLRTGEPVNINVEDACDTSLILGRPRETTKDLYGFRPISAGGRVVTNELVIEFREELGF
jgi:hypothetical protein